MMGSTPDRGLDQLDLIGPSTIQTGVATSFHSSPVGKLQMSCSFRFAPESPQWLIVRRRTPEAVDIVRKISRLNGNTASDEQLTYLERISQNIDKNQNSGQSYTVLDCFRIPKIRKYTILISFVWLVLKLPAPASKINNRTVLFLSGLPQILAILVCLFWLTSFPTVFISTLWSEVRWNQHHVYWPR